MFLLDQAWVDPAVEEAAPVMHRSEHEHSRPFILSKFIVRPAGLVNTLQQHYAISMQRTASECRSRLPQGGSLAS